MIDIEHWGLFFYETLLTQPRTKAHTQVQGHGCRLQIKDSVEEARVLKQARLADGPQAHQDVHGRRLDGDVDGVEVGPLDVLHALHVNVQDADEVPGLHGLDGSFARAVHVSRKLGVLDELPPVDRGLHGFPRDVMVI